MLILLVFTILILPIWNIGEVKVEGNVWYTDEEIVKMSGVQDKNILRTSLKEIKANLMRLSYIKEADLKYVFPGKMAITVVERKPIGYVPFMGTYLCIDQEGRVIGQEIKETVQLPVIKGLYVDSFQIGEVLPIANEDKLLGSIEVIKALEKYK